MAKKAKRKTDAGRDDSPSFEEELASLESIVHELEEGQLGLGDSLQRYEQGVTHLTRCYQLLEGAEQKIELLLDVDSDGNERSEPFAEAATSLEEKAARRGKRRSRRPSDKKGDEPGQSAGDVDLSGKLF